MQSGSTPEELSATLDANLADPFALLLDAAAGVDVPCATPTRTLPSLFASDFDFFAAGIERLRETSDLQASVDARERLVELEWPEDLKRRFRKLPAEVRPDDGVVLLTADPERMQRALDEARKQVAGSAGETETWPRHQLLWANSPVMHWLADHRAEEGVLAHKLLAEQHAVVAELPLDFDPGKVHRHSVEALLTDAFQLKDPPRFVLILGDVEWLLADRGDALVGMGLGLGLEELKTLYRVQFYVLRQNESDTWYDRNGRIVFTVSKGLPGVGLPRSKKKGNPNPCWNDVQHMSEEAGYTGNDTVTQVVIDDTLPGGPREKTIVYQAPWIRCDREKDYEVAWKHFAERFGTEDG